MSEIESDFLARAIQHFYFIQKEASRSEMKEKFLQVSAGADKPVSSFQQMSYKRLCLREVLKISFAVADKYSIYSQRLR